MEKNLKLEAIKNTDVLKAALDEGNKSFNPVGKNTNKGSLENGLLAPSSDQQSIIVDNQAGTVGVIPGIENIWLIVRSGIYYDFTLWVRGACPKGEWDNHLTFTDRSGDTYNLRIFSTEVKDHYVNYHSPDGAIQKITWDI